MSQAAQEQQVASQIIMDLLQLQRQQQRRLQQQLITSVLGGPRAFLQVLI
jgi:hypothetical protein